MIVRQGLVLTAIGLAIALGLGRFTASVLYGSSGTDPLTFVIVSLVLLVTAIAAVLVPALRRPTSNQRPPSATSKPQTEAQILRER